MGDKRLHLFNIQKFSLNDGPGIRTVVFFKGCPLRCGWCSNPESQSTEDTGTLDGYFRTVEEVVSVCLQDMDFYEESGGGVTLSGGECTFQPEGCAELLKSLKVEGISTAVETSGFAPGSVFESATADADMFLFDMKHYDEKRHISGTGVSNRLCIMNLRNTIEAGKNVTVRIPVIPGYNSSEEDFVCFAEKLKDVGADKVQLLPFHQFGESKYEKLKRNYVYADVPALHAEDVEKLADILKSKGLNAFI